MTETLPAMRLSLRWLLPARLTWIGITLSALAVFPAMLPIYYANLQVICFEANCPSQRLSAGTSLEQFRREYQYLCRIIH